MALSTIKVQNAKPKERPYKLFDEDGLFLMVSPIGPRTPKGGKVWRLRYWFGGKEKLLALGTFPEITLAVARARRDEARQQVALGIDPGAKRKAERAAGPASAETFEAIAREWFGKFSKGWSAGHANNVLARFENHIFPHLGARPIAQITAPEALAVLRRIEATGSLETAHRARQGLGKVFRYAVTTGRAERDPSGDLKDAIPPARSQHMAALRDLPSVAALLRDIHGYQGQFPTQCALRLAPLLFLRPGELRNLEWTEVNLEAGEIRIPAGKMKMRRPHIVPLAHQAAEILDSLRPLTGAGRYVFHSIRTPNGSRPMSENTINAALRRLGYEKDEQSGHGFRSIASTQLNEQGWNRDAIERQLAHAEKDEVRGAYNFAEHLPERRRMMQAWADFLDGLREGASVVPVRRAAE